MWHATVRGMKAGVQKQRTLDFGVSAVELSDFNNFVVRIVETTSFFDMKFESENKRVPPGLRQSSRIMVLQQPLVQFPSPRSAPVQVTTAPRGRSQINDASLALVYNATDNRVMLSYLYNVVIRVTGFKNCNVRL